MRKYVNDVNLENNPSSFPGKLISLIIDKRVGIKILSTTGKKSQIENCNKID